MKKIPSFALLVVATFLLVAAVVLTEYALRASAEISDVLFFGVPLGAVAISLISLVRARPLHDARARRVLGIAVVAAILPMIFLSGRYKGDFDPLTGRLAPDGSQVTSISWNEENGRYIERVNRHFEKELTEEEYHGVMIKQQRMLLGVLVIFSSLAFSTSLANVILERGK